MQIHTGTSGWSYESWEGAFYPDDLDKSKLAYYARFFDAVELNNSFYKLPEPEEIKEWQEAVSDDFIFTAKASRYLTHMKKLKDPEEPLEKLYKGLEPLGEQCRVILFQLPPNFGHNQQRLEHFLSLLSDDYRYVMEFRDPDWHREETYEALEKAGVAFCIYELAGEESPRADTAEFLYIRLHGKEERYKGRYTEKDLKDWHDWITKQGKDAYLFFDNTDEKIWAVKNAQMFRQLISGKKQAA